MGNGWWVCGLVPGNQSQIFFGSWVLVAHTCNPSYSGGTDQEDRSLKPAPSKQLVTPYLDKTRHKKGLVEWLQGVGAQKKKKKKSMVLGIELKAPYMLGRLCTTIQHSWHPN
jgi:hypothetical protein